MEKGREIRSFTGLRGVAAVYVMFYHFDAYKHVPALLGRPIHHGYMAVEMFFLLSGFVMAMTYRHLFSDGFSFKSWRSFMAKRIARIYPVYLVMTIIAAIATYIGPGIIVFHPMSVGSAIANALLIQSWGVSFSWLHPAWSISTEMAAYCLFPLLLAMVVFPSRGVALAIAGGCFFGIGVLVHFHTSEPFQRGLLDFSNGATFYPLARCIFEFTIGLAIFRASQWDGALNFTSNAVSALTALVLVALLFIPGSDLALIPVMGVLLLAVCRDDNLVAQALGSRMPHFLGKISYSVYLVHFIVFCTIGPATKHLMMRHHLPAVEKINLLILPVITVVLATASYYWIERPSRHLLRRKLISPAAEETIPE